MTSVVAIRQALEQLGNQAPRVHAKLCKAYVENKGVRLTADDVYHLVASDEAISRVLISASEDLDDSEEVE
jgi:hypothetical protein